MTDYDKDKNFPKGSSNTINQNTNPHKPTQQQQQQQQQQGKKPLDPSKAAELNKTKNPGDMHGRRDK